eukprot:jgi/Orpsp1_1/1179770/evm.model.c7180000070698.1
MAKTSDMKEDVDDIENQTLTSEEKEKESPQGESLPAPHPVGQSSEPTVSACLPFKLPNYPPPPFGKALRPHFFLSSTSTPLNHGSFGSIPRFVEQTHAHFRAWVEASPDSFISLNLRNLSETALECAGELVNADPKNLVFVHNVTSGVNCVLRSLRQLAEAHARRAEKYELNKLKLLKKRNKILILSINHEGVKQAIKYIAKIDNFVVHEIPLTYPISDSALISRVRAAIDDTVLLANFEIISTLPSVILPYERLTRLCQGHGIMVMIDAAHALGQVPVNIRNCSPDFLVCNTHKWFFSARPVGILYVDPKWQQYVHPTIPTYGTGNFKDEFSWMGTVDYTTYLTIPVAREWRRWLGGEEVIRQHNHKLAVEGGRRIAEMLGTEVLLGLGRTGTGADHGEALIPAMVNVRLPTQERSEEYMKRFQKELIIRHQASVTVFKHGGRWWIRVSAQVYNDIEDFEQLGQWILEMLTSEEEKDKYRSDSSDLEIPFSTALLTPEILSKL